MRSARMKFPGHPDKVCDLVAEAIVDEYLRRDPETRIDVSVSGGHGALFISGDVASTADFDVATLVKRTLGSLGVMDEVEPFVSLEPMVAEQLSTFGAGPELPVFVTGYATAETHEMIPTPLLHAKQIAKALDDLRKNSADWFWLGPDGEVVVMDGRVDLFVEHGSKSLADAKKEIENVVRSIAPHVSVRVNELGAHESRGLSRRVGASHRSSDAYGSMVPTVASGVGKDIRHAEKAGAWLARAAARELVRSGAKAAMVHAIYQPGERVPSMVRARDERGTNIVSKVSKDAFSIDRIATEWWRPGLNVEAARWGFTGESGLPWE